MRVLGFGTYELAKHPRAGVILDGLRALGDDVAEINEPLGFSTAERVEMIARPWRAYRLVARVLTRWAALARRSLRGPRRRRPDAVVVGYLGHFDVLLARLLFPRTPIVLDLLIFAADTAQDRGVSSSLRLRVLTALDRLAVRCADVVVLDTEEHLQLLPGPARHKAVIVAVGASDDWFAAGDRPPRGQRAALRVVFFGLYTPLQGSVVIGEALGLLAGHPEIAVTMIGTGQDYAATRAAARANTSVRWVDWAGPDELPGIVAAHDVCLGIFGTTGKASRVVPNKVFQGAAAGCAILTSDTPPQHRALGAAAAYVAPGDPAALASALRLLAADASLTARLRSAAHESAHDHFTPAGVVGPLRARLLRATGKVRAGH